MSYEYLNSMNTLCENRAYINFRADEKPAHKTAERPIEKLVERVDEEKKKKHNKTAIAVGSSVLILSILVALLNPKNSGKSVEKLKTLQLKLKQRIEKSKGDIVATKFYKAISKTVNWSSRFVAYTNNVNSVKDTYYKKLCTEEKTFFNVKSLERRNRLKKVDKAFKKVMKKPHELITQWGESLAKLTVRKSYAKATKKMDAFESLIKNYAEELPADKKSQVMEKLEDIKLQRNFFAKDSIDERLIEQEKLMGNLDKDIRKKWQNYKHGFANKYVNNAEHFDKNLSFWAKDLMEPEKQTVMETGKNAVDVLMGNKNGIQGKYRELIELVSENLSTEEKNLLNKTLNKTEKSLRKANKCECNDYFDKKRDLILGSAPTDILSSIILLMIGGLSIASADDKDKKISRLLTSILPTIAGIGTNIALTTMLFSGTKGMACGVLAGGILSLIGSTLDRIRLNLKNGKPAFEKEEQETNNDIKDI